MGSRRSMKFFLLLGFAAACGGGGTDTTGTGGNKNGNNGNQNPPTQPGGTPVVSASVDVLDDYFSPNSSLIAAGGTVTWTWVGRDGHSVTSDSFTPNADVSYPPKTLTVTFPAVGDYHYFCTVHGVAGYYNGGTMIGTVYVR